MLHCHLLRLIIVGAQNGHDFILINGIFRVLNSFNDIFIKASINIYLTN